MRGNLGVLSFASSLGEVRGVLPTGSDAPGSLFGELVNLTRDSGNHWFLAHEILLSPCRHCRFVPCTLPCSPKVHDVDSLLQGIGHCKPVFGGT